MSDIRELDVLSKVFSGEISKLGLCRKCIARKKVSMIKCQLLTAFIKCYICEDKTCSFRFFERGKFEKEYRGDSVSETDALSLQKTLNTLKTIDAGIEGAQVTVAAVGQTNISTNQTSYTGTLSVGINDFSVNYVDVHSQSTQKSSLAGKLTDYSSVEPICITLEDIVGDSADFTISKNVTIDHSHHHQGGKNNFTSFNESVDASNELLDFPVEFIDVKKEVADVEEIRWVENTTVNDIRYGEQSGGLAASSTKPNRLIEWRRDATKDCKVVLSALKDEKICTKNYENFFEIHFKEERELLLPVVSADVGGVPWDVTDQDTALQDNQTDKNPIEDETSHVPLTEKDKLLKSVNCENFRSIMKGLALESMVDTDYCRRWLDKHN